MTLSALIDWVTQHQGTLTWLGGGVATAAGGAWAVVRFLLEQRARQADKAAKPAAKSFGHTISATGGIAGGRDVRIEGGVTIQHSGVPTAALVLLGLGLLLLGFAALTGGGRGGTAGQTTISAPGGVAAGSITGSPITITPQPPAPGGTK